ncbi:Oidioi.mRNA.OKI2018_I69.PAR.g8895.t1.cds [Oikopleura dioica]|uniref:Oidioi.mRNA.OKI2018_I69.PAR.g8895.t1.cds n=1 Tax=Oikopleura dioica TaxID=34765 RepID=A0ABN7RMK3_OIKDI|nr:Oidioi.mRNA.OKI2018_I69.PAR.g8895.t1.cds [Oikopleura dioica]
MDLCYQWIISSMSCKSQKWRSSKFIHRFQKVIGDALWHIESTRKCAVNRRGKREADEFSDVSDISSFFADEDSYYESMINGEYDDFESLQYQYEDFLHATEKHVINEEENEEMLDFARGRRPKNPVKIEKDEKTLCAESFDNLYEKTSINSCRKHPAWKKRTAGLIRQITQYSSKCAN